MCKNELPCFVEHAAGSSKNVVGKPWERCFVLSCRRLKAHNFGTTCLYRETKSHMMEAASFITHTPL